jgi:hypothetical protein
MQRRSKKKKHTTESDTVKHIAFMWPYDQWCLQGTSGQMLEQRKKNQREEIVLGGEAGRRLIFFSAVGRGNKAVESSLAEPEKQTRKEKPGAVGQASVIPDGRRAVWQKEVS